MTVLIEALPARWSRLLDEYRDSCDKSDGSKTVLCAFFSSGLSCHLSIVRDADFVAHSIPGELRLCLTHHGDFGDGVDACINHETPIVAAHVVP